MKTAAQGHVEQHDRDRKMIALRLDRKTFERVRQRAVVRDVPFNTIAAEIIRRYFE